MTELVMPRLGETVTEGVIVKWLKKEGEFVKKEEPIVEISTDKIETDIPSPAEGTMQKIEAPEGAKVTVGQVIAQIAEATGEEIVQRVGVGAGFKPARKEEEKPAETAAPLSPLVRKLAKEKGIKLAEVKGSGAGGRITKDDVLKYVTPEKVEHVGAGYQPAPKPLSAARRQEMENLLQSQKASAHVTAINEADFTSIDKLRSQYKENFKQKEGFSLTFLPFVAKSAIQVLQKMPVFNAELKDSELVFKPHVNLGIAVALPDGLIVPVIKKAETLGLVGLARAINDVAARAREGKLKPDEVHEGTFSITNNGSFGSLIQTPIIVPGQLAILSLEAINKRVVVVDEAIAIRKMAYLPLTYDHRVIDGSVASTFLIELKKVIETADFSGDLR